jgi:hypothetical protein
MKKTILITLIYIFFNLNVYAATDKNCKELPGFKKIGKGSTEYMDCLADKVKKSGKFKLNTKSKLTDWITGKKDIIDSIPNPKTGLINLGKAVKPDLKPLGK